MIIVQYFTDLGHWSCYFCSIYFLYSVISCCISLFVLRSLGYLKNHDFNRTAKEFEVESRYLKKGSLMNQFSGKVSSGVAKGIYEGKLPMPKPFPGIKKA